MSSFTTQVCDRCKAHFPLEEKLVSDWPVRKIKIVSLAAVGMETATELCLSCRETFSTWFRSFMKDYDK